MNQCNVLQAAQRARVVGFTPVPGPTKTLKNAALDRIADLLRKGVSFEEVARREELTKSQVQYRTQSMRRHLAQTTGDVGWLTAPSVAVGRAWYAEPVEPHLTPPEGCLAGR